MRKLRILFLTAIIGSLALVSGLARGRSNESHKAVLSGYDEVPSVSSTGSGELKLKVDEDAARVEFDLSYENLEGTTTSAAHIHIGQEGVNGGVMVFFCGGGGTPSCTPTSGTFSGTFGPTDVLGPAAQGIAAGEFAEVVRAIRAGKVYVNVHTNKHPGGEIRGQVK